jgi:hypothetical protein
MHRLVMALGGLSLMLGVVILTLGQEVSSLRESLLKTDQELASCKLERARQGPGGVNADGRAAALRAIQSPTLPKAQGMGQGSPSGLSLSNGLSAASAQIMSNKALGMWKAEHSPTPHTFMDVHVAVDHWFTDMADIEKSFNGGLLNEEEANEALREASSQYQKELQGVLGRTAFKPFWNQTRLGDLYPNVPTSD